ncbi:MAG: putative glycoside hydrolase [Endomicrobiales bacterium]|nr:putative glycoside hydrolase [Endomicrobiales bacterium]
MIIRTAGVLLVPALLLYWRGDVFSFGYDFSTLKREKPKKEAKRAVLPSEIESVRLPMVPKKPKYVRGIHITAWVAGSPGVRADIDRFFSETELNTAVIDIKEYAGEVYIPGCPETYSIGSFSNVMPGVGKYLKTLKDMGVYTVARLVVFKDNILPEMKPGLAVRDEYGGLWRDNAGNMWADPYNPEVWKYNLDIAEQAVKIGFEEIQFDYIRFPSDGSTRACRYSQNHSSLTASAALINFLKEANRRLKPLGANISIDVFGLTTTVEHDMGIGQKMEDMTDWVDYISPMLYPSHYNNGAYGIPEPDRAPYHTVYMAIEGAKRRLGRKLGKLRPYLQDFSLMSDYDAEKVRAQIQACYDNGVAEWLLWNPRCDYSEGALKSKEFSEIFEKKTAPEYVLKWYGTQQQLRLSSAAVDSGMAMSSATLKSIYEALVSSWTRMNMSPAAKETVNVSSAAVVSEDSRSIRKN